MDSTRTNPLKNIRTDPKRKWTTQLNRSVAFKLILIILAVSIIPILIVSLTAMYSAHAISDISTQTSQEIAQKSMEDSATALEAELIKALRQQTISMGDEMNQKLHQITAETSLLRDYARFLYVHPQNYGSYPYTSTYNYTTNGSFGSIKPNNNSWLLVSDLALNSDHSVPKKIMDEVYLTEWMDIMFRSVAENDPNAVQLYINTQSQITRGMPFVNGSFSWIDATTQFPADINLPEYDFYYLANESFNPERKTVWTTLYYDPAGLGWMISSISPVYQNNELKGVVGIDITLDRIINSILNVTIEKTGFAFLVSGDGDLIAFPERAGPFLGFSGSLTGQFHRDEQLRLNMNKSPDPIMREIISHMTAGEDGIVRYTSPKDKKEYFIAYAPINETGWSVGVVAPVNEVTEPSRKMSQQIQGSINQSSNQISGQINSLILNNILIIIFILIAMIPTAFILTRMLSKPIQTLINGSRQIGSGNLSHRIVITTHDELEELASTFNTMAGDLDQKLTELEKANYELRQMDELKSQFISIASHELRTPLIAMKGYIDLLLTETKGALLPEQLKMLTIVARNTSRLGRIINEILDMSRIEAKKLILKKEWFSIADSIKEVGEELASSIKKREHTLYITIPENLPLVYGDPDRIAQVIINLLGNAIKYTPDHGTIHVRAFSDENKLFLEIEDTGIGISEADIPHIFTRFYQTTSITSHRTGKDEFLAGGTGLGLAIVKGIVEAHSGEIKVTSKIGKGTTFQVIIPINPDNSIKESNSDKISGGSIFEADTIENYKKENVIATKTEISRIKKTILIIDDEPDTLELMTDLLSDTYTIITASSGAVGLKKALTTFPDLILLDAWMPGITGYDVCRTLKKNPKTNFIPIIMVTAAVGNGDINNAISSGANEYLMKPFESEELFSLVKKSMKNDTEDT